MMGVAGGIPAEIVREHIERLTALMREQDVAATLLFHPSNMLAFTGTTHSAWDRLVCGAITREGEALVLCPAFERPGVAEETSVPTIHTWVEEEDAYARFATLLADAGVSSGRVAVDGRMWIDTWRRFEHALGGRELVDGEPLLREVRMCKSPAEVRLLQRAHERGEQVFLALRDMIRAGVSELELQREVARRFAAEGLAAAPMIQTGANGAIPHHLPDETVIEPGDIVVIDSVVIVDAYHNDLTRTFAVGSISDRAHDAYHTVRRAQAAAIEAARPGVACGDLDGIARRVIADAGYGEYFTHRLGHGMGIECHEPPFLVGGNRETLRPGNCVTIEPGIYIPGEFGIRIEDDIVITDDGCQVLRGELMTDVSEGF